MSAHTTFELVAKWRREAAEDLGAADARADVLEACAKELETLARSHYLTDYHRAVLACLVWLLAASWKGATSTSQANAKLITRFSLDSLFTWLMELLR